MRRFELEHVSRPSRWALAVGVFAGIVAADLASGSDLPLRALYLVPVGLAAWTVGKRAGNLDGFKAVNDTRGHAVGDAILVAVGETLAAGRATDIAARLGGDERALLLLHEHGEEVSPATTRIAGELARAMSTGGWPITFSIGVATVPVAPQTVAEMIAVADALMYEAKHGGKDGVRQREIRVEAR